MIYYVKANNPRAHKSSKKGIIFVHYPKEVMVWSVLDPRELPEIIKRMHVEPNNRPQPDNLEGMIAFFCQGYSYSRILTFLDIDQGFIDKLSKIIPIDYFEN